ncbi:MULTISPECIES: hypothetical protein [Peptostreptococcaceae]
MSKKSKAANKAKKNEELKKNKEEDKALYTKFVLVTIMCSYIVLMFVKEVLTSNYLIHLYIDSLIAVVAFYITIHNMRNQYKILKKYNLSLKPFSMAIVTMVVGLSVIIMTMKSPFDISFLILVVGMLTSKKMFEKDLI